MSRVLGMMAGAGILVMAGFAWVGNTGILPSFFLECLGKQQLCLRSVLGGCVLNSSGLILRNVFLGSVER